MIDPNTLNVLADIFGNTDATHKISVELADDGSRSFTVRYERLDPEWFDELREAVTSAPKPPTPER